jgi:hypothetical protein
MWIKIYKAHQIYDAVMPLILVLLNRKKKKQSREYSLFQCPVSIALYRAYIISLYLYIKWEYSLFQCPMGIALYRAQILSLYLYIKGFG